MTTEDTIDLSPDDLRLIKRVLAFATHDIPISDALENKLYPTTATRQHAADLDHRLGEAGVEEAAGLFVDFDPHVLEGKVATARFIEPDAEHTIKARVAQVTQNAETGQWHVTFSNGTQFFYNDREDLKKNSYVELDQ